jgi:hypothetical protein
MELNPYIFHQTPRTLVEVALQRFSKPRKALHLASKSSAYTPKSAGRQRLMYGVNLNVFAERHAALHFKARQLQARYLTKFEIPVALEASIASKEVLVRRRAPPGKRPFLEINGQYRRAASQFHQIFCARRRY